MDNDVEIITGTASVPKPSSKALQIEHDPEAVALQKRMREAEKTYGRGRKISVRSIKDKKLRSNLKSLEDKYKDATLKAKDAEILLENESGYLEPEGELERTYKVRQDQLRPDVAIETAKKGFEFKLEGLGPYTADYTRNGRGLLLAGRKGHVATMDWRAGGLGCELQLQETVRDAKWLHNDQYFAVAQKKYVYIYDHAGVELHCLKQHIEVTDMQFLPYHFLLATVVCHFKQVNVNSAMLKFVGQCWLSQVYRYVDRPNGYRTTYETGITNCSGTEPTKRHHSCGTSERYSHTVVSKLKYGARQGTRPPRTHTLDGN